MKSNAFRTTRSLELLDLSHNFALSHLESHCFSGLSQLHSLDVSFSALQYLNADVFSDLKSLTILNLRSNSLTMIEPKIASFVVNLQVLDVRDNPLVCNCSIDWVRSQLSRQTVANDSSSFSSSSSSTLLAVNSSPSSSTSATATAAALESSSKRREKAATTTTSLLTANYKEQPTEVGANASPFYLGHLEPVLEEAGDEILLWLAALQDVKCTQPGQLTGKRLIDLHSESIGCFKNDSMKPIVIIALVSGVALGIFIIIIIRFRVQIVHLFATRTKKQSKRPHDFLSSHPSFLPSPITVSSKLNPTAVTTLHINNNHRKVYGFDPLLSQSLHSTVSRPYHATSSVSTLGRISFDELGPLCAKPEFIYVHNNSFLASSQSKQSSQLPQLPPRPKTHFTTMARSTGITPLNVNSGVGGGGGGSSVGSGNGGVGVNVGGAFTTTSDRLDSFEQTIYPSRHAINNLNNPYEVVPIVPQFAPPSAFHSIWPDGNRTHSPFVDSYSDRLYEEANCPLTSDVKMPSTEL